VTASRAGEHTQASSRPADGWQASRPELVIAITGVTAVVAAAYAWAGGAAAVLTLACSAFLSLGLLRSLPPAEREPDPPADQWHEPGRTSIAGFWRKRGVLKDATVSMASFEHELRPTLQHLLAARLAERYGISLYADPDAARRLLLPRARDQDLWPWLDPRRPPTPGQGRGVPARTLAAIIDRLEQL
jgi:hypothetical protein